MSDAAVQGGLCVAIDRAARWVAVAMLRETMAAHAVAFFQRLIFDAAQRLQETLIRYGRRYQLPKHA